MLKNYHTHSARCGHARGTDREYIESAIAAGLTEVGISDHNPAWFPGDYYSDHRMGRESLAEYVASLEALRAEYADRIHILIGCEVEYYRKTFDKTMELLAPFHLDYIILGQHFLAEEQDRRPSVWETAKEEDLAEYADLICTAVGTGKFSYVAHPDIINFIGDAAVYRKYMEKICDAANAAGVPLEINFLGIRTHRAYPREEFFKIAGEKGCRVIFGCDAHEPESLCDRESEKIALTWCKKYGLQVTDEIPLPLKR